jgi:hypothetical protein
MTIANVHTFNIPRENIPALERKLKALAKRANKLELGEVLKWTLGDTFEVLKQSSSGRKSIITYTSITITIAGDVVLPGGWHLVGVLDHTSADTPIILSVPGEELPVGFRTAGPDCNHCHQKRRRNTTIVIRDEQPAAHADHYKQIGSTCIADYLGHKSALDIAKGYQYIGDFIAGLKDEDESGFYRVQPSVWELADCLAFTAAIVRLDGWAPRSNPVGTPTADIAWSWFERNFQPIVTKRDGTIYAPEVLAEDTELAAKATAWLLDKKTSEGSDYIYNVQTIARGGRVTTKTIGLAASIIGSYKRDVERQLRYAAERKAKNNGHVSEWVGAEKERLRKLTITVLGTYETEGNYGLSTRVVFQDEKHNDFIWFASGSVELKQGESYIVDATVKRHNEFKGNKQTQVNRVRVVG